MPRHNMPCESCFGADAADAYKDAECARELHASGTRYGLEPMSLKLILRYRYLNKHANDMHLQ